MGVTIIGLEFSCEGFNVRTNNKVRSPVLLLVSRLPMVLKQRRFHCGLVLRLVFLVRKPGVSNRKVGRLQHTCMVLIGDLIFRVRTIVGRLLSLIGLAVLA